MNLLRYAGYGLLLAHLVFCVKGGQHPRICRCAQCQQEKKDRRTSAQQLCELVGMNSGTLDDAQFIAFAVQYDLDVLGAPQRQALEELTQRHPQLLSDLLQDIQA